MIQKELIVQKKPVQILKFVWVLALFMPFLSCSTSDSDDLVGNWVELNEFNGVPRSSSVAVSLDDKAYITLGYNGDDWLDDIWEYDPVHDYWMKKDTFPGGARAGAVGFAINGKVYVGTGFDGTNKLKDFWEYDPTTDVWTQKADFLGSGRYGAVAFAIGDKGYIGAGFDGNYLKDYYEYNPSTDTWTQITDAGSKRKNAMAFVIDGEGYVCGGVSNSYEDDFWKYNPETGWWTELRSISDATDDDFDDDYVITRTNAAPFVSNGKAYLCSGGKNSTGSDVWEYTPSTDLWEEKTSMEGGINRMEAVGFSINGVGYVATGRNSSLYFDDVWRFEPDAEYDEYD